MYDSLLTPFTNSSNALCSSSVSLFQNFSSFLSFVLVNSCFFSLKNNCTSQKRVLSLYVGILKSVLPTYIPNFMPVQTDPFKRSSVQSPFDANADEHTRVEINRSTFFIIFEIIRLFFNRPKLMKKVICEYSLVVKRIGVDKTNHCFPLYRMPATVARRIAPSLRHLSFW